MTDSALPQQPLGVLHLISETFEAFFSRIFLFFGIAFVPSLFLSIFSYLLNGERMRARAAGEFVAPHEIVDPGFLLLMAVSTLLAVLVTAVSTLAAYDSALERPVRIGDYIGRTMASIWPMLVLGGLFQLVVTFGMIFLVVPGLYLAARFVVFTPAILIDGSGFAAFGRASSLSEGYRWPIVGAVALYLVLPFAIGIGTQFLTGLLLAGFGGVIAFIAAVSVLNALNFGLAAVFVALLYARLCEIKEGRGMEDLADVFR